MNQELSDGLTQAWVAVGTGLAACPPHGSRRAELPHRALASDPDAQALAACRILSNALCQSVAAPGPIDWFCRSGLSLARPLPSTPSADDAATPRRRPCSGASSVLRACPTSRRRSSPSRPMRVHGADADSQPTPAHDSGPVWPAPPSPYGSFIRCSWPVSWRFPMPPCRLENKLRRGKVKRLRRHTREE